MSQEAIELLRSIDGSLKTIVGLLSPLVQQARATQPKPIASDRDLDGKYGDPVVKLMPRDWTGQSFKGRHMSECPAELLEMLAETFEYFATQAEQKNEVTSAGKPVAGYKRADAARARGWAKRVREGRVAQPAADEDSPEWASGGSFDEGGGF